MFCFDLFCTRELRAFIGFFGPWFPDGLQGIGRYEGMQRSSQGAHSAVHDRSFAYGYSSLARSWTGPLEYVAHVSGCIQDFSLLLESRLKESQHGS